MLSHADILEAHERIKGQLRRTPSEHSITLSKILGAEIYIKFENLQFTAAFKERGALNKLLRLREEGMQGGVIAMSAGNHAKAVAHHATRRSVCLSCGKSIEEYQATSYLPSDEKRRCTKTQRRVRRSP